MLGLGPCRVFSSVALIEDYALVRCTRLSLVAVSQGYSAVAVLGLLIVMAFPVAERNRKSHHSEKPMRHNEE